MEKKHLLKLIVSFLKLNRYYVLFYFLFAVTISIIFSLYNIPHEPLIYAFVICLYMGLIFLIIGFYKFYRKHKQLLELDKNINIQLEQLPDSKNLIEQDYIRVIHKLYNDKMDLISKADTAKSDLIDYFTLWAHQIKTPIAAMHLLLQSEHHGQNDELSLELFKIEQYVETVLQYLRFENMTSDLVLKRYHLDSLVKQAIRKYAKMFIRKKIRLNYSDLHCDVLTDEKWLVFVIEQIISNAIKYTNEGSISIYLDHTKEKTLVIEDTGIGIAPEDLPRVFEKGFTGYNGRSDKKSTGIGLFLCKQILTKLSHSISIESGVGKGTKISIDLAIKEIYSE